MKRALILSTLALSLATAFGAAAQSREGQVISEPGMVGAAQTVSVTGTIKAIDQATRAVTVVGPEGREVTLTAGPEVKNFAQLKAGDQVAIQYAEALVVELKKGGGQEVKRTDEGGVVRAEPGTPPGGIAGRKVTVVGDVIGVDAATQRVTVRGPQRTVNLNVRDPAQFERIAVGDQLEATYLEAVAVDVSPAASK